MPRDQEPEPSLSRPGKQRRRAMIEAAYKLFMEKGYAAVSLDEIINVSKGSKSSLYKFFGNKEGILKAVIEELAEQMIEEIDVPFPAGKTPREALQRIGMVLVDMALSDNAINQHRHAVAHAKQFPEVGKLWFESGPNSGLSSIALYLEKEHAAGRLRVPDPARAGRLFAGMILFRENMRRLVCLPPAKRAELKKDVAEAVEIFVAAYGIPEHD